MTVLELVGNVFALVLHEGVYLHTGVLLKLLTEIPIVEVVLQVILILLQGGYGSHSALLGRLRVPLFRILAGVISGESEGHRDLSRLVLRFVI